MRNDYDWQHVGDSPGGDLAPMLKELRYNFGPCLEFAVMDSRVYARIALHASLKRGRSLVEESRVYLAGRVWAQTGKFEIVGV